MNERLTPSGFFKIAQKYLINTIFDSVNTIMGIILGLFFSGVSSVEVISISCISAAIAMGLSSGTGNYEAEFLEQKRVINEIESDMLEKFTESSWKPKAMKISFLIGLSCFATPVIIASAATLVLVIFVGTFISFILTIILLLAILFFMGFYVGMQNEIKPIKSAIRMLIIGISTFILIFFVSRLANG
jgi:predicted membrane protein (TIGR00267 family)